MITYKKSNIYTSEADMILCLSNTDGTFEEGTMLEFRLKFPDALKTYRNQAKKKEIYALEECT